MSSETDLLRIQAIQNQRNFFSKGFPLPFNVKTLQAFGALFQFPHYYRKCLYYTVCPRIEFHSRFKLAHSCQKKANLHNNELNTPFFLFDEPLKGSKSLKIFKISLTFRFDKLSNLSKSVQRGENSQILTVSNKKNFFLHFPCVSK
jgi:hypothetical protein